MRLTKELKAFFAFAESLPISAALIKREIKNAAKVYYLWKKNESQNYLWNQFMVEGPRNNALIKVDSFDLRALCENTRSQNFNHKVASWPRSSTWKQRLLNLSWHWKQITNRAELGTSVWSKNVSSFFGSWSRGTIKPTIMIKGRPQLKKNVFFRALPE